MPGGSWSSGMLARRCVSSRVLFAPVHVSTSSPFWFFFFMKRGLGVGVVEVGLGFVAAAQTPGGLPNNDFFDEH